MIKEEKNGSGNKEKRRKSGQEGMGGKQINKIIAETTEEQYQGEE